MSEKEFGNRIPFAFLEDIKEKFLRDYAEKGRIAEPLGLNREFKKVLKKQMVFIFLFKVLMLKRNTFLIHNNLINSAK